MEHIACTRCGSNELAEEGAFLVCAYCRSRFSVPRYGERRPATTIDVNGDIRMLLQKCADDPANLRRYASLVLDLDPENGEALEYLRRGGQ